MNDSADKLKEFSDLIEEHRPREAFVLFLKHVEDKSWRELKKPALAMLDTLCQRALPELREHYTLWMVNHPDRLRRMLELLTEALAVNYRHAATVDHIAWLRCLLAIAEAMAGRVDRVHQEFCLVRSDQKIESIPRLNGTFHRQIRSIEPAEGTRAEFLEQLFAAYMEFLKRVGQYDLSYYLENRIGKLLGYIARDEKRPGVVQALFYDKNKLVGHSGFVHVSIEHQGDNTGESPPGEAIEYTASKQGAIDGYMQEAAACAHRVVDAYLKRTSYPDGLAERLVRWEIATVQGDVTGLKQEFQGGSIALPLAVAVISKYLGRPVANDIASTGAFTVVSVADGSVLPVDGVPEKVKHAVLSGCRLIFVPTENLLELKGKPALQNLISEHDAQIVPAESLDKVCEQLFPPEGSGRLKDLIKDAFGNYVQIFKPILRRHRLTSNEFAYQRYSYHVLVCSVLTMLLVLLESWMMCKTCAPDFPSVGIWIRIIAVAVLAFVGTSFSFVLPDICLQHRKRWSWIAGTILLAVCLGIGGQLLIPVITGLKPVNNSPNIVPTAFFLKDMFLIWVFTWVIAADSFNVVTGAEHLLKNRQFITSRECLKWNSLLEIRMPVLCIYFPWKWGTTAVIAVALILIAWEMRLFSSILRKGSEATHQLLVIAICREFLFLVAISEVLIFYKTALANIRKMFR